MSFFLIGESSPLAHALGMVVSLWTVRTVRGETVYQCLPWGVREGDTWTEDNDNGGRIA